MRAQFTDLSLNVMCRMLVGDLSSRMHDLKQIVHEALRVMGYMPIQDYLPILGYWFDPNGVIRDMHKVMHPISIIQTRFKCQDGKFERQFRIKKLSFVHKALKLGLK